ncbi:threonine/homoserine/homoserine lactone efflux protein [Saccharothrix tamanrassetensis]|uniref:Threonine/homoserine/homoserine lactone efflux protein n=1 Tax=Saccharothrix tamanrassetensis TaxID=1051531 RepID=A0A841CKG1_9PSEU|nr:LysE family translocator [Saccharothrix tamanrassetensis]MBB5956587.1 threonine/homoserine/homoserine lactone efflux protein [Saccharothrix tamanrassetensis]
MWSNLAALVAASFLIALSPGPGTALVLRQSVRGRASALATVFGMEIAVAVWAVAAALGLSVLLTASEVAYHSLRIAGAVFLVYLGVKAFRSASGPLPEAPPAGHAFRAGLVVNLANPKLGVFAISFLPQFLPAGSGRGTLLLFALVWVAVDTLWYLVVVGVLDRVRGRLTRSRVRRALERVSGGVLIALGLRLVFDPR